MLSGILIYGCSGGDCYFFTMSDEESAETHVVVASQASQIVPSSQTTMNRPQVPQVKPPPHLNLARVTPMIIEKDKPNVTTI